MKSYCFSCLPKKFCQEKASLRIAKLRKEKMGQKLRKTEQQRKGNFFEVLLQLKSKNFEQTPEGNCMEHAAKKIQIKKMIWRFIENCSVKQTESVSRQQAPTFDLSCNLRLNLAQSLKSKDTMMLLQ